MQYVSGKIKEMHLSKQAVVYVRQSTARQVHENTESTKRQYELVNRLMELGWDQNVIRVVDQDLGKSGAGSSDRDGFSSIVADVMACKVGVVACIECSRLSRDSEDWLALVKACEYAGTLLIDADGVYSPGDFNDRLLLGLKGTMSEAELHLLRQRMYASLLNKARRGELRSHMPVGYVYDGGLVVKTPDQDVRDAIDLVFRAYRQKGTAGGVVSFFNEKGLKFPRNARNSFCGDDIVWDELAYHNVLHLLHNPAYAGVYCFGRVQKVMTMEGKKSRAMPRGDWHVFIPGHHEAYITLDEFEDNALALAANCSTSRMRGEPTPAGDGPALLQGIARCGKCGRKLEVHYSSRGGTRVPNYRCGQEAHEHHGPLCQFIPGLEIDRAVSELLVGTLTAEAVEQSASVMEELDNRRREVLALYGRRIKSCEREADLAWRRYERADPENRLIIGPLEEKWNQATQDLENARIEYAAQHVKASKSEDGLSSADDLPQRFGEAFLSDTASWRDKKNLMRYLIEGVTLLRVDGTVHVTVRFKGGSSRELEIAATPTHNEQCRTGSEILGLIDAAAESHNVGEIADILNRDGHVTGKGLAFTAISVRTVMNNHSIPTMKTRYLSRGFVTLQEKAALMGISDSTLNNMINDGRYQGEHVRVNAHGDTLFPPQEQ